MLLAAYVLQFHPEAKKYERSLGLETWTCVQRMFSGCQFYKEGKFRKALGFNNPSLFSWFFLPDYQENDLDTMRCLPKHETYRQRQI